MSWSPDDRSLVYSPDTGGLFTVDLKSLQRGQLTAGSNVEIAPIVSRAGRIMYSTASHQTDLYIQGLEGGEETRLTSHSHDNFQARLSPDGLPGAAGPPEMVADGKGLWHVHNGGWSPDGRSVIYTRDTDQGDVYVLDGAFD